MEAEISHYTDLTQWQGITKILVAVNENSDYWTKANMVSFIEAIKLVGTALQTSFEKI